MTYFTAANPPRRARSASFQRLTLSKHSKCIQPDTIVIIFYNFSGHKNAAPESFLSPLQKGAFCTRLERGRIVWSAKLQHLRLSSSLSLARK